MKISFKILGGYFVISLLLIAMGVVVIRTSYLLNPVIKELDIQVNKLDIAITISDLTANIVFLRSQLRLAVTQFYFTNDPSYVEKYAHSESQLERVFNKIINQLTNEDNRKIFQNLKSSTDKLGHFEKSFIASVQEDQSAAFELLSQDREYQRLNKSISNFINSYSYNKKVESEDVFSQLTAIANALQVSKKEINWQSQITLFLIVVVCIASILVGVIVSRSISNPIIKLRNKVDQIGKGEFDVVEETASRDEIGDLVNAFSKMTKEIRQSQERLRDLAARLQTLREEEQKRIAREIHDELGQMLIGLRFDLAWMLEKVPKPNKALTVRVQAALLLVGETLETVRRISHSLRPLMLDDLGLIAAIEWQVGEFSRYTGFRNRMALTKKKIGLDNTRDTVVFRILQESLTNVARHAQADQVEVSLSALDSQLVLRVEDNGIGIDNEGNISRKNGFGILGMHERCEAIGGKFQIEAIEGGGTRVICTVPLSGTA